MMQEKLLPCSIEAEQGVLGSLLINPSTLSLVYDRLKPQDFYRTAHRHIYEAIRQLGQEQEYFDFVTLCDALEQHHLLEDAGGASYLSSLVGITPTSMNIMGYAHIVERTSILRKVIQGAGKIAAIAYEPDADAQKVLEQSEQILFDIRQGNRTHEGLIDLGDILTECLAEIEHSQQHPDTPLGVTTGFKGLDELLGGGLQKTDLILLAGRPGSGKTSLGVNIGYNAARRGKRVAVFSLEMGKKQLGYRLLSMLTGIASHRLRNGWISDEETEAVVDAQEKLSSLPISIDDTAGNPVLSMRNQLRMCESKKGKPIDLIIVDYIQLIESASGGDTDKRKYENRVQELDKISRALKQLAKDFNAPVLALAQLSRKVEERASKIPMLSDLRESGSLEQDSDGVVFIYRDEYYNGEKSDRPGIADIIVAKHRNGPTGELQLKFAKERTRFYGIEEVEEVGR